MKYDSLNNLPHMDKTQIFIPAFIVKMARDGYVTVPESFRNVLIRSTDINAPDEYFFPSREKAGPYQKI